MFPNRGADEDEGTVGPGPAGGATPADPGPTCDRERAKLKAEARTDPSLPLSARCETDAMSWVIGSGVPRTVAQAEAPHGLVAPSPVPRDTDAGAEDDGTEIAQTRAKSAPAAARGPLCKYCKESKIIGSGLSLLSPGATTRPDEEDESTWVGEFVRSCGTFDIPAEDLRLIT